MSNTLGMVAPLKGLLPDSDRVKSGIRQQRPYLRPLS
jgi:hypothetical protein